MVRRLVGVGLAGVLAGAAGLGSGTACSSSSTGGTTSSSSGGSSGSSGGTSTSSSSSGGSGGSTSSGSSSGGGDSGTSTSSSSSGSTGGGSDSGNADGGTDNFDSCSVVTEAEAAAAIGETVTAGVLGTATVEGGLACVFYGPSSPTPHDPNTAQADSVRVVVVEGADALTWYNDYKSKVNAQAITGYGDQAYYDGVASLSVMKGNYYLRVAVSPAGAPPSLTDEEKLATAILPSL
ncbi:MAG: hypothetical protein ACLP1X_03940 [Polyangiaceae bacterium]|jgi:hypothetical protein